MSPALAVALGAALGAPARYLLDRALTSRSDDGRGVLAVNLIGCLLAGLLAGGGPSDPVARLVGVGILGSFTTASTVAWDVLRRRSPRLLAAHVVGGLVLAGLGLLAGRALASALPL